MNQGLFSKLKIKWKWCREHQENWCVASHNSISARNGGYFRSHFVHTFQWVRVQIQQGLNTYGGLKRHARVQEVHNHDGLWHYIITIKFIICLFKIYVRTHLLTLLTFIDFTLFLESLFNLHNMLTNRHMSNKFKFVKKQKQI